MFGRDSNCCGRWLTTGGLLATGGELNCLGETRTSAWAAGRMLSLADQLPEVTGRAGATEVTTGDAAGRVI